MERLIIESRVGIIYWDLITEDYDDLDTRLYVDEHDVITDSLGQVVRDGWAYDYVEKNHIGFIVHEDYDIRGHALHGILNPFWIDTEDRAGIITEEEPDEEEPEGGGPEEDGPEEDEPDEDEPDEDEPDEDERGESSCSSFTPSSTSPCSTETQRKASQKPRGTSLPAYNPPNTTSTSSSEGTTT
ncbi:hypothetical protein MMC13_001471 [Lambiella insularis]|nr:hypothetical protein [Lambiella insularis]